MEDLNSPESRKQELFNEQQNIDFKVAQILALRKKSQKAKKNETTNNLRPPATIREKPTPERTADRSMRPKSGRT